ncbi:hypothetical protein ANN_25290 [Periplaneta americana]|uniref:Uncharacterized protein n=1 Tax=Periplaneta americana TaxID=6978 RepID=A0ABQ8S127_PERAM|nr:hypothetical protein ANN_25290 [Periplaneta americana]
MAGLCDGGNEPPGSLKASRKMADDSLDVTVPFDNKPDANPYGMLAYDFGALTSEQQRQLNILKINTIREDHIYLATHPEVRAITCLLLRAFCKFQPRNVHEFASYFISQPDLQQKVDDFIKNGTKTKEKDEEEDLEEEESDFFTILGHR